MEYGKITLGRPKRKKGIFRRYAEVMARKKQTIKNPYIEMGEKKRKQEDIQAEVLAITQAIENDPTALVEVVEDSQNPAKAPRTEIDGNNQITRKVGNSNVKQLNENDLQATAMMYADNAEVRALNLAYWSTDDMSKKQILPAVHYMMRRALYPTEAVRPQGESKEELWEYRDRQGADAPILMEQMPLTGLPKDSQGRVNVLDFEPENPMAVKPSISDGPEAWLAYMHGKYSQNYTKYKDYLSPQEAFNFLNPSMHRLGNEFDTFRNHYYYNAAFAENPNQAHALARATARAHREKYLPQAVEWRRKATTLWAHPSKEDAEGWDQVSKVWHRPLHKLIGGHAWQLDSTWDDPNFRFEEYTYDMNEPF